jgi:hypothetical protein
MHPKLRSHWPPDSGGAATRGMEFLQAGERGDRLQAVYYYAPVSTATARVVLKTRWRENEYSRDLLLDDRIFAERLAGFLKSQVGRTMGEIAQADIDF